MLLDELPWKRSGGMRIEYVDFGRESGFYLSRLCGELFEGSEPKYYACIPSLGMDWKHLDPIEAQCAVYEYLRLLEK